MDNSYRSKTRRKLQNDDGETKYPYPDVKLPSSKAIGPSKGQSDSNSPIDSISIPRSHRHLARENVAGTIPTYDRVSLPKVPSQPSKRTPKTGSGVRSCWGKVNEVRDENATALSLRQDLSTEDYEPPSFRSSGRKRRKPGRFSEDIVFASGQEPIGDACHDKGISQDQPLTRFAVSNDTSVTDLETRSTTKSKKAKRPKNPPITHQGLHQTEVASLPLQSQKSGLRMTNGTVSTHSCLAEKFTSGLRHGENTQGARKTSYDSGIEEILKLRPVCDEVSESNAVALNTASAGSRQISTFRSLDASGPGKSMMALIAEKSLQFPVSPAQLKVARTATLEKLTAKRVVPMVGLDDEYCNLYQLFEQTIVAGEGNSMLLIGARGTGKSALVNHTLRELAKAHKDNFHVIRLSGFVQTDDKLALREIWRQLGREMEMEEEVQNKNYAETLSILLAMLSNSSESAEQDSEEISTSVIFIIDEFDLFALHPRQTLLYNLFDIAQSRKVPIAVLGLTTRVDVTESLEKRVKSRFSHRHVYLALPKTLVAFQDICKAVLQLKPDDFTFQERKIICGVSSAKSRDMAVNTCLIENDFIASWNIAIEALFQAESFNRNISRIYYISKSVPTALSSMLMAIGTLTASEPYLTADCYFLHKSLEGPDCKLHLLPSLPNLSVALLIAAARLEVVLEIDTCNFNMVYNEYSTLAMKSRMQASVSGTAGTGIGGKMWGREVAKIAWGKLIDVELLVPVGATGAAGVDMFKCDVALEEIDGSIPGLEVGMARWCREI